MATVSRRSAPEDLLQDPVKFVNFNWPDIRLYSKQVDIMYSVRDNDETIVPAGNMLGKDYITGLTVLWFFCSRSPCRIVTSSAGQSQLKAVLWGEIRRFMMTSKYRLPLQVNDLLIRQVTRDGGVEPKSYIMGITTNVPENLQGHHLPLRELPDGRTEPRTLIVFDEASSIHDKYYTAADTWAHRKLVIGNPLPCTNFFYRGVKDGPLKSVDGKRFYRNVIRICAEDSPNVAFALKQKEAGIEPTGAPVLEGVLDWDRYVKRRATWDKVKQTIGLDGLFYEGAETLLYPPEWLDRAQELAKITRILRVKEWKDSLDATIPPAQRERPFRTLGVDTAEGGDSTVWTVIDILGIIYQKSMKTQDTSVIAQHTIDIMKAFEVKDTDVLFDRGGGGKQHADYLRKQGHNVRTVAFGEAPTKAADAQMMPGQSYSNTARREERETRYAYKNRRAEMYGMLRFYLLDPLNEIGFAIPEKYTELRRQLSPLPILYDPEGRIYLPPKDKPPHTESKIVTLREMLGCSPDEADSLVLAVFGQFNRRTVKILGTIF